MNKRVDGAVRVVRLEIEVLGSDDGVGAMALRVGDHQQNWEKEQRFEELRPGLK